VIFVLQFVYVTIIPPDNTINLLFYIVIHRELENGFGATLLRSMSTSTLDKVSKRKCGHSTLVVLNWHLKRQANSIR